MNLAESDLQIFRRFGIFPDVLERAGVGRVTSEEAQIDYGIDIGADTGLVFPYYSLPNGQPPRRVTARIRRDNPPRDENGKIQRKYVSPYPSDPRHLYFAPCEPIWVDTELPERTPVVLVEAEKSALALLAWCERHDRRLIPVALGGCWNWRGRIGKTVNEEGERVDEKGALPDLQIVSGRRVYVIYDANCVTNNSVYVAREKLIEELLKLKSDVRVIDLPAAPGVNGPDDFIASHGDSAFFDLFESAVRRRPTASGSNWRDVFHSFSDFENAAPLNFAIKDFLQNDGATLVGGLSGHGKTLVMLSIARALLSGIGTKLWGHFDVLETAARVIYLIPESSIGPFKYRLQLFGLYDWLRDDRILVRTLSLGPAPCLSDPRILLASKGAHVFLDTAVRFQSEGDENSAGDNQRGLARDIFALLGAGARTVIGAHHAPKPFAKEPVMRLENVLRGSGDIGAMVSTAWGIKQLDADQNIIYIENVKPRDFQPPGPFQLIGRPFIDENGCFRMHKRPGECGSLADEQRPERDKGGAPKSQQETKAWNMEILRHYLAAEPNLSDNQVVQKFKAAGIEISRTTVLRYRKELDE
jgi:hypothetical protein